MVPPVTYPALPSTRDPKSHLEANRANAQKSTGPRTEANREAIEAFCQPIIAELSPVGAMETQLAQSIATFQFRINRIAAIEQNLFSLGDIEDLAGELNLDNTETHSAACQAKAFRDDPSAFDRLSVYSQRLSAQCDRATKQLRQMQEDRRYRRDCQMTESIKLYKYFQMTDQQFDPRQNGFVCTIDEIRAKIRRDTVRAEADLAQKCGLNPEKFAKAYGEKAA